MKLLVLDGNSIVNRAFYGIKLLTTKDGHYTNAIYGFLNILSRLMADEKPDEVAIAFDLKAPTFRHKMYADYKGTRKGMPQELADQMPVLKEILAALGFVMVSCEGWEADDLLGTLALACKERGDTCRIATGDKDSLQLIAPEVSVLLASTKGGKSQTVLMDEQTVLEQYGVPPHSLIDVKALMGDKSDNIPGVGGIGEKTALRLIANFGSLQGVYEHLEDSQIKPGERKKLIADQEKAEMARTLVEIRCDAPIETKVGTYCRTEGDPAQAIQLFAQLEMPTMVEKFHLEQKTEEYENLPEKQSQPLDESLMEEELFLLQGEENWFAVDRKNVWTLTNEDLEELLANSFLQLKVFDAKPLYKFGLQHGIRCCNIVFDGKLAAYLLNPSASDYTISQLGAEYHIKPEFFCKECPESGSVISLFAVLEDACKKANMQSLLVDMELPLSAVLAEMEQLGVEVDKQGLVEYGADLQKKLDELQHEIHTIVGYEFNLNSPKQLGEALFDEDKLGLPPRKKTKSGYSTDAETLESLREYHPVIEKILQYRTYQKLNSTYAEGLLKVIDQDGRIHSTFTQTETRTGRISSNEPNLQNIPIRTELGSQLRKYFVAKEGCVFLDADYSQIELRIMAHISGDEAMQEAFRHNADIHRATAARLYNIPANEVTPRMRSSVKAVNFGILYGKGAFTLARDLGVSVKEADEFIKTYLGAYPKVKEYMDSVVAEGIKQGYVTTLYHRRRFLPELSSSNRNIKAQGERMALNTPIQGTAADIIKLAMVKVANRLYAEGLKAKLILQVHDELIVECPVEEIEMASQILREEMEQAAQLSVPLTADVNQGQNWLEAH